MNDFLKKIEIDINHKELISMGNLFSQFTSIQKPYCIMTGLDAVGKTTILHKLQLGKVEDFLPNLGLYLEKLQTKKLDIISWDIGSNNKVGILCRPHYKNSKGIIYVIDCFDNFRMDEAKSLLHQILLEPLLIGQPVLIYANKNDLIKINSEELAVKLMIEKFSKNWHIQPCCAITGEGLQEGINWIQGQLK